MDFNATIDLIIRDLEEAGKIIDDLKKYPGIPALQIELAKSKCKSAGEVMAFLKTMGIVAPANTIDSGKKVKEQDSPSVIVVEELPLPAKKEHTTGIIGDSFSHLSNSVNEKLSNRKPEEDVSEILKSKPILSLSDAIGINDRFLFIREIFDGNKDAYSQAIARLDKTENLKDARAVIMSYTGDNKENEAVKQLIDLVKRKLHSNE